MYFLLKFLCKILYFVDNSGSWLFMWKVMLLVYKLVFEEVCYVVDEL